MPGIPFEIREAIVDVCGKAFWYKDPFRTFLLSCGVPQSLYDRYADESKYKIARHLLAELDAMGDDGVTIQRRLVTELCKLRKVPDDNVPDKDAAISALRWLKDLAGNQTSEAKEDAEAVDTRMKEAKRRQAGVAARAKKMRELHDTFIAMATSQENPQSRGYGLEDLLGELFAVHEISYRPPYRTDTEQIDGHFKFKGFDYLVEARWRKGPPSEADLGAFKTKVDKKIASTRGVFVSIVGFRNEVVLEFTRGVSANIVLVDGTDLALIFEGQVSLLDALEMKVEKAAQEGIIYFPLSQRFER